MQPMSSKSAKRGFLKHTGILSPEGEDEKTGSENKADQTKQSNNILNVHQASMKSSSADSSKTRENKKTVSKGSREEQKHAFVKQKPQDCSIDDTPESCRSHTNPAFQDDDGAVAVTDSSKNPHNDKDQGVVLGIMPQNVRTDVVLTDGVVDISERKEKDGNGNVARDTVDDVVSDTHESGMKQHLNITSNDPEHLRLPSDTMVSPSHNHTLLENVSVVSLIEPRRSEESKLTRPHSRSISSMTSTYDDRLKVESVVEPVQRSYSMRVSSMCDHSQIKPRKLLRDLSFSDVDARSARNYGVLRASQLMPRREPNRQAAIDDDSQEGISLQKTPQLETPLTNLMQELLFRGKIRQVAVLAQKNGSTIASLPPWKLSHRDEIGLVKATTCTLENMLKITVGDKTYTIFKHGTDKIMGRSGDSILVAHKTNLCVVVGVADGNVPGSCLYEMSELACALMDKGW